MKTNPNIFLVEDDINFGTILKSYLELNGFMVTWISDGKDAMESFNNKLFDICILDVMLPHIDGFSIAREIRKKSADIPLIFLTAKSLKVDILKGFDIGADDYVTKPFDSEVLLCKIKAILKRNQIDDLSPGKSKLQKIGKYKYDYELRILSSGEKEYKLSPKENELLRLLCIHRKNILPREEALRTIWGDDNYFTTRSMDVFITKLRKYLQDDPNIEILNVHGSGFRLFLADER